MNNLTEKSDLSITSIYEQYHPRIYGYILKLVGHPNEAEDLTQETFLRVIRQLPSLQNPDAISAWLYRIATNLCYDRFRQDSFRTKVESIDESEEGITSYEDCLEDPASSDLGKVIDQDEMSACVQRYLNRLSDDYRSTILFHDLHGMTCAEIAEMQDCSLETVKIRLHWARLKLKTILAAGCHFSQDSCGVLTCDPKSP